jgi:phosphatidate cytidylyltransferase
MIKKFNKPNQSPMKEITIRSITGAALVLAIVVSILLGPIVFAALFLIITLLGTYEYYKMIQASKYRPQTVFGTSLSVMLYILMVLVSMRILDPSYLTLSVVLFFIVPIRELYRNHASPIPNIAQTLFGILYVGLTLGLLNFLFYYGHDGTQSFHLILVFFVILWTSDTFAYLTGISIGKHRLFERISPKKSWEGFFGGLIAALGVGYISSFFFEEYSWIEWLGYAAVTAVAGVYGDLVQSMFKRSLGIKDSGNILPGHGGILDRFDAVLLAIPAAIAYIMLIN